VASPESRAAESPKRFLEPVERIAEVLFGLIMVLTFTGSLSVAEAGRDDVRAMLIGALGCNIAWGVIDGLLYLMGSLAERGTRLRTYHSVLGAPDARAARRALAGALPPVIASLLEPAELDELRERIKKLPPPPKKARLHADDWLGTLGVFLIVFFVTFPVAIPFIVMESVAPAMRVSNAIAVSLLFVAGYAYGKVVGRSPILVGFSMVLIGAVLVAFTIALGG
jgi:hypothetical protein